MTEQELVAWLRLSFVPNLGMKRLKRLLAIDSPCNILNYSNQQLLSIGFSESQINHLKFKTESLVEECLVWQDKSIHHHLITHQCAAYPPCLRQIASAPSTLFVRGNISTLSDPQIAMVGSRNASLEGLQTAKTFAREFTQSGLIVTSGSCSISALCGFSGCLLLRCSEL